MDSYQTGLTYKDVSSLATHANGDIFAGAFIGLLRSTDNGDTWISASAGLPETPVATTLSISPNGHIFVGTRAGVYRSTNSGESWTPINVGLPNLPAVSFAITSTAEVFVGTAGAGVFHCTDDGDTWTEFTAGLSNPAIQSLAIDSGGFIFAGTRGSGVIRTIQSITSVEELSGARPRSFFLEQNYPNPFNPTTTFQYRVPTASHVVLRIHNSLGQEVQTLVDEMKQPGVYRIQWHGQNRHGLKVGSGVYIVRMVADDFVSSQIILLMK